MTRNARTALLLLAGATLSAGAAAQANPYFVGASVTLLHNTNLLRLPSGQDAPTGFYKADTAVNATLLAGFDQLISRQRVYANASLTQAKYARNTRYSNQAHTLTAGVDWSTAERVAGTIKASTNQNLARINAAETGLPTTTNIETTRQLEALVRFGLVTAISGEVGASHRGVDYSAATFISRQFSENAGSFGVRYRPSAATSIGVALRATQGKYPNYLLLPDGTYQADRYKGRFVDITGDWKPTGGSTFDARVSLGKTSYDSSAVRNFNGPSLLARWNWQPGGKLKVVTTLSRDPGQDQFFGGASNLVDFSRVTDSLQVRADYELFPKINVSAGGTYAQRNLAQNTAAGALSATDRTGTLLLGASWRPLQSVRVGCDLGYEARSGVAPLSASFNGGSISCNGQFTLQ